MSRILLIGSGAVGCAVGAALTEAGCDVARHGRKPLAFISLRKHGTGA